MKVVIDYRNICKIMSYSILSGTVPCIYPTEPEEIAHRLMKRLFCFREEYPHDTIFMAVDAPPYWRTSWLNEWYSARGLEPVLYKGNRAKQGWTFATSREDMDRLYEVVLRDAAEAMGLLVIKSTGLEADDIWGIIADASNDNITGVSSDSDWRQLCHPCDTLRNFVQVYDPATDTYHKEQVDILPKCIAGDRGDNIMGCNKRAKDGSVGKTAWGKDGVIKLLEKEPETWMAKVDMDVVNRNRTVVELPCPSWDLASVADALSDCVVYPNAVNPDINGILDKYGVTSATRKMLQDKALRHEWLGKLRSHLESLTKKDGE